MGDMQITGNVINKCRLYNIAIAKAKNITISGYNKLYGNTPEKKYGECINLEHKASDIGIINNTIHNEGLNKMKFAYISILTFRDYDNENFPDLFLENDCRNITIKDNRFKGNCNLGITGEFARDITIKNNIFFKERPASRAINFWIESSNIEHEGNVHEEDSSKNVDLDALVRS